MSLASYQTALSRSIYDRITRQPIFINSNANYTINFATRILHFCRLNLQPTFIYFSSRLSICLLFAQGF